MILQPTAQSLNKWNCHEYNSNVFSNFYNFKTGSKCKKEIERLSDDVFNALFHFLHTHAMHLLSFLNDPNLQ